MIIAPCAEAAGFGDNSLWDDGLAEVARYDSKTLIYGRLWDHEKVLIVVKEDFTEEYYTKADAPYKNKKLIPVIKLNIFTRIQTMVYPYQYLTSVFVKKNDVFYPLKMTVSSQEWCGNTFKEWINWKKPARIVYHSYFDNQGDGSVSVDYSPGNMLWEQLFFSLRALAFRNGYKKTFKLYDSLTTNQFKAPGLHEAKAGVSGPVEIEALKKKISCWKVTVETGTGKAVYWFAEAYPHSLIRYTDSKGQEMRIKKLERTAYWNK